TGKVLLATVKGDVHDIGKNILNVVLSCNNYEILDLGVMVPCEKILATAKKENVDFIGLSGLITPSLKEMEHVAIEMEKEKLSLPLLIGGATTSEIYAAVKLSPLYSGPVVYAKDASQVAGILASIKSSKEEYVAKTNKRYEELRKIHNSSSTNRELLTIEEARANKLKINWKSYKIRKPINVGRYILRNINIRDLEEYIDWTNYFIGWGIKGKYPNVFNDKKYGEEARKLFDDTLVFLEKAINNNLYSTAAVFGIFPANSDGDDIIVYNEEKTEQHRLRFYREQSIKKGGQPNLCLSDYILPLENGKTDYLGLFTVTVKTNEEKVENNDYSKLMTKILANSLAEALTEYLHEEIRKEYWGFGKHEQLTIEDMFVGKYQGIRPAPGYESCPDHSEKSIIFEILNTTEIIGVELTENYVMNPISSVCGYIFSHPEAKYFRVGTIGDDQKKDYENRK
ncbi:MAG: cobalamin-dependent protein, partial [Bacteroidales bacterium]|nr:cobalamin-dependent protein [Bacteroidales bacterium]